MPCFSTPLSSSPALFPVAVCLSCILTLQKNYCRSVCFLGSPTHPHRSPQPPVCLYDSWSPTFMVYKYMGPNVVRPWVQQKSAGYRSPSDLIVPREATATTIRCYAMSMTGNAYYCSVRQVSPRSRPALSLRRFGEETSLHLLGSALVFNFRA